jgi:hypothetical protein
MCGHNIVVAEKPYLWPIAGKKHTHAPNCQTMCVGLSFLKNGGKNE